jgi:NADH dehydrogenase (ubiquinone) 1 alpha subcomplex subunit 13
MGPAQELPPAGGYSAINFKRVPAKTYFRGSTMIAAYVAVTTAGLGIYYANTKKIKANEIEMRSARLALQPLLFAERDREYLKQLRRNRDEEASLMKDVEGWTVGHWFSEPIFKTIGSDEWRDPIFKEYYAHASPKAYAERANVRLYA